MNSWKNGCLEVLRKISFIDGLLIKINRESTKMLLDEISVMRIHPPVENKN